MKKRLLLPLQIAVTVVLLYVVLSRVHFYGQRWENAEVVRASGAFVELRIDGKVETLPASQVQIRTVAAPDGTQRQVASAFKPGLADVFMRTNKLTACLFGALAGLVVFFTSLRLYLLLRVQKFDITLGETIRYSFIGIFFNWVLPGLVTGDLVKWYFISKKHKRVAMVGLILALDRIIGAFVLFLIASVVSAFFPFDTPAFAASPALVHDFKVILWVVRAMTLAGVVGAVVLFSRTLHKLLRVEWFYRNLPAGRQLEKLHQALLLYRAHFATLAAALAISVGVHATTITCNWGLGGAMGIHGVSYVQYAVFMPVILTAVGVIPLSLGGLGLRETMYVLTFKTAGVPAEAALNLDFTFYALSILWSLPGAIFYLERRDRVSAGQMQRELSSGAAAPQTIREGESNP